MEISKLNQIEFFLQELESGIFNLEKSYSENDGESFKKYKQKILDSQKKINELLT